MNDIKWKPLPQGLWTPPAEYADIGDVMLSAFVDDGIPKWEIGRRRPNKHGHREYAVLAKGTADTYEAAKSAVVFEVKSIIDVENP